MNMTRLRSIWMILGEQAAMKKMAWCCLARTVWLLLILVAAGFGCGQAKEEKEDNPARQRSAIINRLSKFTALPDEVKHPANNPPSAEKVELGRLLFFDPILSGDQDVACATCHHPSTGFAENLEISIGVNGQGFGHMRSFRYPNEIPFTKRNSQTILNTAFNGIDNVWSYEPEEAPMFWDLRVQSLENQALEPIKTLEEMRGLNHAEDEILQTVVQRLEGIPAYQELFTAVFGAEEPITPMNIARAIAAYERTLVTNNSRFDKYMRGDESSLSLSEKEGFEQFKRSGCGMCHNGPMFSDFKEHVLGIAHSPKLPFKDMGIAETYAFRTPSLRNLRYTAPYMHNGTIPNLLQVLEFYEDIAAGQGRNPDLQADQLDPLLKHIRLKVSEMRPIISFLNALNDDAFDKTEPAAVPSGLPVGGTIQ